MMSMGMGREVGYGECESGACRIKMWDMGSEKIWHGECETGAWGVRRWDMESVNVWSMKV